MKSFNCFTGLFKGNHKKALPLRKQSIIQIKPIEKEEHEAYYKDPTNQVQERTIKSLTSKKLVDDVTYTSDDEKSGHVSDPGLGQAMSWVASPKLKRSCSTLSKFNGRFKDSDPVSDESVRSHKSVDRVLLKKHSSMQILPSGSRRLWWKLFLWSNRNLHKQQSVEPQPLGDNIQSYSTETSTIKRVDEWVKGLNVDTAVYVNDDYKDTFPTTTKTEVGKASRNTNEDNNVIKSSSKSSNVAYISTLGLKVIPNVSHFVNLKSIDLSNNFIAHITHASLPKGIHTLNLSKNKINVIEGLRDLTRLRVLDLSYNRISRIGQGLSNCTLIKELYLTGNKISNVEGLHRLLKLIVLDLSFNKIATTKAIGQLVANYNSLIALNIIGNPIHNNVGEDQLRKTVSSLLPKLVYFNKQLTKPQRAREVLKDSVARAAFGGGDSLHHKRKRTSTTKKLVVSASTSIHYRGHIGDDKPNGKRRGSKDRRKHQLRKISAAETPTH